MKKNECKRIRYKHVRALRDLGGVRNFNRVHVKKGLLYRSSYLGKMSLEESDSFVHEFNVGTVIDLRAIEEVEYDPDIKTQEVKYYHFPVLRNEHNPAVLRETRADILIDIVKNHGGAVKYLEANYRRMVSDEYSLEYFRQIFDILLSNEDNKAIVYHCTQGKDRTGVCSTLILYALGVDKFSIMRDYMRYNNTYRVRNAILSGLSYLRFFSFKCVRSLYVLQTANKKLIRAVFDEIKQRFGTREEFLRDALLLTEDNIAKLKEKYLEK